MFFNSDEERKIWIRINAELIQYTQKLINGINNEIGKINLPYSPMWISNNQLTYDEYECDAPRFSLDELLSLSISELFKLNQQREEDEIQRMFLECKKNNL